METIKTINMYSHSNLKKRKKYDLMKTTDIKNINYIEINITEKACAQNALSIGYTSKLLGVSISTLRRWDRVGKLSSFRTLGHHRRFFSNELLNIIDPQSRTHVGYARVSSIDQKKDLETQSEVILKAIEHNEKHLLIKDLGSGLNYKKTGLRKLINMIINFQVDTLYMTHKDRLLRFGSELIFSLCASYGTKIVILEMKKDLTFEEELTTDVIELMTVFSAKLYGKRSHKNKNKLKEIKLLENKCDLLTHNS